MAGGTPAAGASAAERSGDAGVVAVIVAPPAKKRLVWPVWEMDSRLDTLCVSAMTASGAHPADWGEGDKMYEKASDNFNEQPLRRFMVDGKALKDRFKLFKNKYEKKEAERTKSSGTTEEVSEMDDILADACSDMNGSRMEAEKAKEEVTKEAEALPNAEEPSRRSTAVLRVNRRGGRNAEDAGAEVEEPDDKGNRNSAPSSKSTTVG